MAYCYENLRMQMDATNHPMTGETQQQQHPPQETQRSEVQQGERLRCEARQSPSVEQQLGRPVADAVAERLQHQQRERREEDRRQQEEKLLAPARNAAVIPERASPTPWVLNGHHDGSDGATQAGTPSIAGANLATTSAPPSAVVTSTAPRGPPAFTAAPAPAPLAAAQAAAGAAAGAGALPATGSSAPPAPGGLPAFTVSPASSPAFAPLAAAQAAAGVAAGATLGVRATPAAGAGALPGIGSSAPPAPGGLPAFTAAPASSPVRPSRGGRSGRSAWGMCLEEILSRMRSTRAGGYTGRKFYWKTTDAEYNRTQRPLFQAVAAKWLELPLEDRRKWGCANDGDATFPTKNTSKHFITNAKNEWQKKKSQSTSTGQFWNSMSPIISAIQEIDKASSNDGDGTSARNESTDQAQKARAQRLEDARNQAAAAGNVGDMMESLQAQAESMSQGNGKTVELAEKQAALAQRALDAQEESAEYAKARDQKTDDYRRQQTKMAEDRFAQANVQHAEMMDVLSNTLKAPPGGVITQWDSYEEFWVALPNIPVAVRDIIMENVPSVDELVSMAEDKNFWETLKEANVPVLVAKRLAKFVQKSCYLT
ncbi:unnamed protein product [Ectocarpus sp. CCAP 1310/34]|nr:unnamed protein product [Ectocarpus sp. CCAP 1310/34]